MLRRLRSYVAAMRASSMFGRAAKLRRRGQSREALEIARRGLGVLRQPIVRRYEEEGSVLLSLTMLVEQLASELQVPGATDDDLRDALTFLRRLPQQGLKPTVSAMRAEWLPYLEARVGAGPSDGGAGAA